MTTASSSGRLVVSGAREHNLRDLHLSLPRDALNVITGLSGSGKSSLAFDTIYAEGQRRYVESLSAYARQFLGQMDKPDVDSIEGLSPAISIDQKTTSRNPRSTVGTVTEIYDYLRLLWARIGRPHCPTCGNAIAAQSAEQIVDQIMTFEEGTRFMVLAPVVRGRKGEYGKLFEELRGEGYTRVRVDGEVRRLEGRSSSTSATSMTSPWWWTACACVRTSVAGSPTRSRPRSRSRRGSSRSRRSRPPATVRSSTGPARSARSPSASPASSAGRACPISSRACSRSTHRTGRARCTGLGSQMEIDPELIVPDPTLSLNQGAILPWSTSASNYYETMTQAIAERYEVDTDAPWDDLPEEVQDTFLYGTDGDRLYISYRNRYGRRRSYTTSFEGIVANLERRYREHRLRVQPREDRGVHVGPAVPGVRRRPAAAREPGREGRRAGHPRAHADVGRAGDRVAREPRPERYRAPDRPPRAARDRRAAALSDQRRRGLSVARSSGGHAVGR